MQVFAEKLVGFTQTSELAEGGVFKIVWVDAEAVGNVVADGVKPAALVFCKTRARTFLFSNPFGVSLLNGLGDGDEVFLRLDGVADEGDEVHEAAAALALHLLRLDGFVELPETLLWIMDAKWRTLDGGGEFFDVPVLESRAVGAAVENLEGLDLVLIVFDEFAEIGADRASLVLRDFVVTNVQQGVLGDFVDDLFDIGVDADDPVT